MKFFSYFSPFLFKPELFSPSTFFMLVILVAKSSSPLEFVSLGSKLYNKGTRTKSVDFLMYLYVSFEKIPRSFFSIYTIEFEQVNAGWFTFHLMNKKYIVKLWPSFWWRLIENHHVIRLNQLSKKILFDLKWKLHCFQSIS